MNDPLAPSSEKVKDPSTLASSNPMDSLNDRSRAEVKQSHDELKMTLLNLYLKQFEKFTMEQLRRLEKIINALIKHTGLKDNEEGAKAFKKYDMTEVVNYINPPLYASVGGARRTKHRKTRRAGGRRRRTMKGGR